MRALKKFLPQLRDFVHRADMFLFTMSVICALYGIVVIASATKSYENGSAQFVIVQTLALVLGILLFIAMTVIDVDIFAQHWTWLYGLSALLLLSLIPFGAVSDTGNNGWLRFFGIGIQPTEIVKLAFIIVLAKQLAYLKDYKNLNSVTSVAQIVGHFILMFGLILVTAQDLGSALVYFFIFAVMLFVAGVKIYWFIMGAAAIACMVPIFWTYFLEDYQRNRILAPYDSSIDPDNTGINWQQNQSKIALASGQLTGTGLGDGTQSQSNAIPGKHTDFIFSVTADSVGFVGCMFIIALYFVLILRLFYLAYKVTDRFGSLVIAGVASMLLFHIFENIGMTIGIMPVTGIPLPFLSYGGSSMLANMAAIGFVLNVVKRQQRTVL